MLQAIIALAGLYHMRVLTWSSLPLDAAAALLHDGKLTHCPGRCMHNVIDSTLYLGPWPPSECQPSAWESHPGIKKIIIILWCLVLGCSVWYCIVKIIWVKSFRDLGPVVNSWSIIPSDNTNSIEWSGDIDPHHGYSWAIIFIIFIVIQGGMTLGLL